MTMTHWHNKELYVPINDINELYYKTLLILWVHDTFGNYYHGYTIENNYIVFSLTECDILGHNNSEHLDNMAIVNKVFKTYKSDIIHYMQEYGLKRFKVDNHSNNIAWHNGQYIPIDVFYACQFNTTITIETIKDILQ